MKYIDADNLLAELDTKRKDCLIAHNYFRSNDPELASFYEGKAKMCTELSYYINSLKQEQPSLPSNIDEAADTHIRRVASRHPGWDWETQDIADAFIAGVKWIEEQGVDAQCINSYNPVSESPDIRLHCITLDYEENENIPYVIKGDKLKVILRRSNNIARPKREFMNGNHSNQKDGVI